MNLPTAQSPSNVAGAYSGVDWSRYAPVADEMAEVEQRIRHELRSRYDQLQPILDHGLLLGGKRMRPALVLLCGAAAGPIADEHITLATVMEMIHTATLVHDDVLDSATHRRHVPTIHTRWNPSISILLGDYLFSHSYYLAATLGSTEACRLIGEAARAVCEGEMRQVLFGGDSELDERTYLELIRGKTAELTRVSCLLGAQLSGAETSTLRSFAEYGESLGIAFQMADDYLDLWGSPGRVGKTLGSDLRQGKATLPLIRFLSVADPSMRRRALSILRGPGDERLEALMPMLEQTDARRYTLHRARGYVERATEALANIPSGPATSALVRLAELAVHRDS